MFGWREVGEGKRKGKGFPFLLAHHLASSHFRRKDEREEIAHLFLFFS
jgi:hypothetical protein